MEVLTTKEEIEAKKLELEAQMKAVEEMKKDDSDEYWFILISEPNERGEILPHYTLSGYDYKTRTENGVLIKRRDKRYEYNFTALGQPRCVPVKVEKRHIEALKRVPRSEEFVRRMPLLNITFKRVPKPTEEEVVVATEELMRHKELIEEKHKESVTNPQLNARQELLKKLEEKKEVEAEAKAKEVADEKAIEKKKEEDKKGPEKPEEKKPEVKEEEEPEKEASKDKKKPKKGKGYKGMRRG